MTELNLDSIEPITEQNFSFKADGGEYLLLLLKSFFLSLFTLGIYWFWAKVEITKFFYKATRFQSSTFDYHATGYEKFIGFLKAFGIFLVVAIINGIISWSLQKSLGEEKGTFIGVGVFYVLVFAVIPIILIGALRFRLSRTSFKGIRFQFLGDPKTFTILFLKSVGLTIITFGFYGPWAVVAITTYITENSLYGNHSFDLKVKGEELFFIYLKGLFLTIITIGFYSFWFRADLHNYFWNNYFFQNGKTISKLTGGKIFIIFLKSIGFLIISLGFAFPWVILMNKRVYIESVSFSSTVDFEAISSIPAKKGSAVTDSMGGDALDSFGSIVG